MSQVTRKRSLRPALFRPKRSHRSTMTLPRADLRLGLIDVVPEYKKPNCRGQVFLIATGVNVGDKVGHSHFARVGDFFKGVPKSVLEADAAFAATDYNR